MTLLQTILGDIGEAPDALTPTERGAWQEILTRSLPGAYTERERPYLEVAARQLAMRRLAGGEDPLITAHAMRFLRNLSLPEEAIIELLEGPDELSVLK